MASKLRQFAPYLFLIIVASWSVWPVIIHIKNSLPLGHEDILITWIINHNIQKIPNDLLNIFNGNIFFPYKNTMAYSELFVTSSVISYLPVTLTGNFLLGFNLTLILGQILTAIFFYLWLKDITEDKTSSVLGATVFILSQIRMHYFVHIQMWNLEFLIGSMWFLWKYAKENKIWQLYTAAFFLVLQVWESILPVFWIIGFGFLLLTPNIRRTEKQLKHFLVIVFLIFVLSFPVFSAYYKVSSDFNFQRTIRDAANFSMNVNDIWGIFLSPGLYLLGFFSLTKIKKADFKKYKNLPNFLIVTCFGLLMSLGPVLKWWGKTVKLFGNIFIPLPYGVFYYIIPGFGALRTPSRWMILFALGLSAVIAIVFSKYKGRYKQATFVVAVLIAIFGGTRISKVTPIPNQNEFPAVYKWLGGQEGDAVLEMPIYTSGNGSIYSNEFYRMLYSLYHRKNLVNGASGFDPPPWQVFITDLNNHFPDIASIEKLRRIGVDFVIVHKSEFENQRLVKIYNWGEGRAVYQDENTVVYKL